MAIDPAERWDAVTSLRHPFFAPYHDPSTEPTCEPLPEATEELTLPVWRQTVRVRALVVVPAGVEQSVIILSRMRFYLVSDDFFACDEDEPIVVVVWSPHPRPAPCTLRSST